MDARRHDRESRAERMAVLARVRGARPRRARAPSRAALSRTVRVVARRDGRLRPPVRTRGDGTRARGRGRRGRGAGVARPGALGGREDRRRGRSRPARVRPGDRRR